MADQPPPPEEPLPPPTTGPTGLPPVVEPEGPRSQLPWLVGGAIALIVAVVAIVFLLNRQPQATVPSSTPTPLPATATSVPSPSPTTAPTPNLAATIEPAVAASVQAIQTGTASAQASASAEATPPSTPTGPPTAAPTPAPATATPVVPGQPVVPVLPSPSASASASPAAASSTTGATDQVSPTGGLGNTRADLDGAYGASSGEDAGALVVYQKGAAVHYKVNFTTDRPRAAIIAEVGAAASPWTMDTATGESRKLFPRDAQPRGGAAQRDGQLALERFHSSSLGQVIPVVAALGGAAGDFLVVYQQNAQGQVTDIIVGIGDSADDLLSQTQE
jgi:hypothetical protein